MKNIFVYIITKEGRAYTTEGLNYITSILNKNYGITDELVFMAGSEFNNPEILAEKLKSMKNIAIVVSMPDKITTFYSENGMEDMADMLLENKNKTSWQSLYDVIKEHSN